MKKYNPSKIESKWQEYWQTNKTFAAHENSEKEKRFVLVEFPYPSGDGLHMGHLKSYTAADVLSRYYRMQGKEVMYPLGWDAFGLPAENYAIKHGIHPTITTAKNIENIKKQCQRLGYSFDWDREINTTDPKYYKWTQWLFLQFYKAGLAYEATGLINWCPKDKTGLANEEVVNGACERCGTIVEKKELRQWYLKITAYAEKLLEGLKNLPEWPEAVKLQQENWIGKSTGAEIEFNVIPRNEGSSDSSASPQNDVSIKVFTTRVDTIFGATYLVLAPEHPLVNQLVQASVDMNNFSSAPLANSSLKISNQQEVLAYVESAKNKEEQDRTAEGKEKTGVELKGIKAINPANNEQIPVWVADYVLGNYGTGAIMAVPAHDERDFAFAEKFNIAIKQVVAKNIDKVKSYLMGGNDISDSDLKNIGIEVVETLQSGDRKILIPKDSLKVYEDLIVRAMAPGFWNEYVGDEIVFIFKDKNSAVQRVILSNETAEEIDQKAAEYVGETWNKTSPWKWLAENDWYTDYIVHHEQGRLVNSGEFSGMNSEEALPKMAEKFGKATVQYKLRDWVFSRQRYWGEPIPIVHCEKDGVVAVPDDQLPVLLPEVENYEPTGTGESPLAAIDEWVNTTCPTCAGPAKRETNTMPQWAGSSWYYLRYVDPHNDSEFAAQDKLKYWLPVDTYFGGMEHTTLHLLYSRFWNIFLHDQGLVPVSEPYNKRVPHGIVLAADGTKMSKSKGNVVNPDELVSKYGADTTRMYELFLGPHKDSVAWSEQGTVGVARFLDKVWTWVNDFKPSDSQDSNVDRALHNLIKSTSEDIESFSYNTAVSGFMKFYNEVKDSPVTLETMQSFVRLLYPFAPHISEEFNEILVGQGSVQSQAWPKYDESKLVSNMVNIVIQVNGKVKDNMQFAASASEQDITEQAIQNPKVVAVLNGAQLKRTIYVPGRLLNIVI